MLASAMVSPMYRQVTAATTEPFTQVRMKPNGYALSAFAQVEFYGFLATKFQPALIIELPAEIERI
jgi:hypothetical protein